MFYLITNNIAMLGGIAILSVIIAGVITGIVASANIFGSGLNPTGTAIVFILIFGGAFYGISVVGLFGSLNDDNSLASVFYDALYVLGINTTPRSAVIDMSRANLYGGGITLTDFPYKGVVDILFGIMYALGLYLLIAHKGE